MIKNKMILRREIYSTFLFLFLLLGCSNTNSDKTQNDFKNYFCHPDWFNEPKVYEYKYTNNNGSYFAYKTFERVDDNKVKSILYDKDCKESGYIIYDCHLDKITITEMYTIETWNNNKTTRENLFDNIVFEHNAVNKEFGFSHTTRFKNENDVKRYVTRTLKEKDKIEYQGELVNVIKADGETKVVITNPDKYPNGLTMINKDKLIYAENIGAIYQESKSQYGIVKLELTRIIGKDEFEKIKNAR